MAFVMSCQDLVNIYVDDNNEYYSSVDGVLFNKDKTKLISYPSARVGEYAIPSSVTSIGWGSFYGCRGLTNVAIPESVKTIND